MRDHDVGWGDQNGEGLLKCVWSRVIYNFIYFENWFMGFDYHVK
jgi:hypothetical protein